MVKHETISQFHNFTAYNYFFLLLNDFSYNLVCMMMMGCWSSCLSYIATWDSRSCMCSLGNRSPSYCQINFSLQPRTVGKMLSRKTMSVDRGGFRFWISCIWWNSAWFYGFSNMFLFFSMLSLWTFLIFVCCLHADMKPVDSPRCNFKERSDQPAIAIITSVSYPSTSTTVESRISIWRILMW